MKKKHLGLAILLIIIIILVFWLTGDNVNAPTDQQINGTNQESRDQVGYQVDDHGFYFELPTELEVEKYNQNNLAIGIKENEIFSSSVEITIMEKTDEFLSVEELIKSEFLRNCDATGAGLTIKCTDIEKYEDFTNSNDLNGFAFYLKQETSSILDDIVEIDSKGPFYAFELDSKIIITHPPINQIAIQSNPGLIKEIADTINKL